MTVLYLIAFLIYLICGTASAIFIFLGATYSQLHLQLPVEEEVVEFRVVVILVVAVVVVIIGVGSEIIIIIPYVPLSLGPAFLGNLIMICCTKICF